MAYSERHSQWLAARACVRMGVDGHLRVAERDGVKEGRGEIGGNGAHDHVRDQHLHGTADIDLKSR
jgi:hypothetical protein